MKKNENEKTMPLPEIQNEGRKQSFFEFDEQLEKVLDCNTTDDLMLQLHIQKHMLTFFIKIAKHYQRGNRAELFQNYEQALIQLVLANSPVQTATISEKFYDIWQSIKNMFTRFLSRTPRQTENPFGDVNIIESAEYFCSKLEYSYAKLQLSEILDTISENDYLHLITALNTVEDVSRFPEENEHQNARNLLIQLQEIPKAWDLVETHLSEFQETLKNAGLDHPKSISKAINAYRLVLLSHYQENEQ